MTHRISKKSVFLIDGSSFLYRAYYGLKPLHSSDGKQVQAVYGFCRMIKKLIDDFQIDHLVIVWDSKGKTKRHEIFNDYKATRQAPPSDIFEQKDLIQEFAELVSITQIAQQGVEADDLLFSAAMHFKKYGYQSVIVTSDKDIRQVVQDDILIFDPFKNIVIDGADCEKIYGFGVEKLPFYFSLIGDSSDNIPGVKGIGPKGATELVQQFNSLDDLYANLDKLTKERTRSLLIESKDDAYLSLQLFMLEQYPVDLPVKKVQFHADYWNKAAPFFERLGFKSLLKNIPVVQAVNVHGQQSLFEQPQNEQVAEKKLHEKYNFITVRTEKELRNLCDKIIQTKAFAIDTETNGLDPMVATLVGVSVACHEGTAYYVPISHKEKTEIDLAIFQKYFKAILADEQIEKWMHHAKYDQLILSQAGMPVCGVTFDTMIAASLLVKDWEKKGLKDLSVQFFCETMLSYQDVVEKYGVKYFQDVPLDGATHYAACDAHQTLKLVNAFRSQIEELGMHDLFYGIELPVNEVLVAMQKEGIFCDIDLLAQLEKIVDIDLEKIEKMIFQAAGKTINLNSPKQMRELLFDTLKLPVQKKSGKGTAFSTDAHVLKALTKYHEIPAMILAYRELFKLKSTYIQALPGYVNPQTDRIHTSWNQTIVATGRISSSNPNLQNIPRSGLDYTSYDVDVRAAFKAKKGWSFISADYSQIELRILAQLSQDKTLKNAFLNNQDIHQQTAARLFQVDLDKVTTQQRDLGKRINFSILYGLTAYGLVRDLGIAYSDAKLYIDRYFEQFSGVQAWMETVIEHVKKTGYTKTLYGRRRYLPGIYEKNKTLYDLAVRIAINTPAQGTAAEIIKIGMISFHQALKSHGLDGQILLQIHDELLVSCPDDQVEKTSKILEQCLVQAVSFDIPLQITLRIGKNWKDVTK